MSNYASLIDQYLVGPEQLRQAGAGMSDEQLDAASIPGKWSTRQVVCHIADFEPVYADRMKRVIAESEPTFFGGDPDVFAARLAYDQRDVEEELQLSKPCATTWLASYARLPTTIFTGSAVTPTTAH